MKLGKPLNEGKIVNLEPVDAGDAPVEQAPVGPTVADPITGEVSEFDRADVEVDA